MRGEGNVIMKDGVLVQNEKIKPYCTGWIKFVQIDQTLPPPRQVPAHQGPVPFGVDTPYGAH